MALSSALLDGATLHAAGWAFARLRNERTIQPINVLAICALIDAFVLFDKLFVDRREWEIFNVSRPKWGIASPIPEVLGKKFPIPRFFGECLKIFMRPPKIYAFQNID